MAERSSSNTETSDWHHVRRHRHQLVDAGRVQVPGQERPAISCFPRLGQVGESEPAGGVSLDGGHLGDVVEGPEHVGHIGQRGPVDGGGLGQHARPRPLDAPGREVDDEPADVGPAHPSEVEVTVGPDGRGTHGGFAEASPGPRRRPSSTGSGSTAATTSSTAATHADTAPSRRPNACSSPRCMRAVMVPRCRASVAKSPPACSGEPPRA